MIDAKTARSRVDSERGKALSAALSKLELAIETAVSDNKVAINYWVTNEEPHIITLMIQTLKSHGYDARNVQVSDPREPGSYIEIRW